MSVMVRIGERMVFEQNFPGERTGRQDAVLWLPSDCVHSVNRRTSKGNNVPSSVISVGRRGSDRRDWRLFSRNR